MSNIFYLTDEYRIMLIFLFPVDSFTKILASDVLWSDPCAEDGLYLNTERGIGLIFGPNITMVSIHG